ncbi:MAG: MBL fold metallo-hydrolase [Deltaproteobacteria bacterium]|jgi:phosphoribosyl 1,2-cyclic phosphodiesterase|nr:MBL fold metallo-hydrolase [Deltaproteobacteria bacterium]
MLVRFWGVRGSLPSPAQSPELKERIQQILQLSLDKKLTKKNLPDFIASLPAHLTSLVGGNTPCLEVSKDNKILIFDSGSGIRKLGDLLTPLSGVDFLEDNSKGDRKKDYPLVVEPLHLDMFFTHTHWDHIQGFPFFAPIYDENTVLTIYAPEIESIEKSLRTQQSTPRLFPIHFDDLAAKIRFKRFPKEGLEIPPFTIDCLPLPHPGGSTAYRVRSSGRTVVFATDYELVWDSPESAWKKEQLMAFIQNSDLFISDTQYTYLESHSKEGWGHSNALNVVEMAHGAGVKNLYLFHHDPSYDDKKLHDILEKATAYTKLLFPKTTMRISLATEDTQVEF